MWKKAGNAFPQKMFAEKTTNGILLLKTLHSSNLDSTLVDLPLRPLFRKAYRRVEVIDAGERDAGSLSPAMRESLEHRIVQAEAYEQYLVGELEGVIHASEGHGEMVLEVAKKMDTLQLKMNRAKSESERNELNLQMDNVRREHTEAVEAMLQSDDGNEEEHEAHLMEQLFYTRQMMENFKDILDKHDGHAERVVGQVLLDNGVDEQIYHNHKGTIIGNHCITFGEKGLKIADKIRSEMLEAIEGKDNRALV